MKKLLFLTVALVIGFSGFAQVKPVKMSSKYQYVKTDQRLYAIDEPLNLSTQSNPSVAPRTSKNINEVIIGTTRYDLQTNGSVQNRIYLYPDGTIGATYTFGTTEPNFTERGTGYNYFNGTSWGPNPTTRIESERCGWPSYNPFGNGELIVSHNGTTGLLITQRAAKGTGAWATTTLSGPLNTGNTKALLWPRTIVSGNTIHIIACTDQATSPAIWYYHGLALALVYIRSIDGGTTWDAPIILPGMDSATIVNNVARGFAGDGYSWAAPKGDTIAFVVGNSWQNVFIMKSFDGGTNWTKIPVYNFPDILAFPTPRIMSNDGSLAIALDNSGKAHVTFGRMAYSKNTANMDSSSYYPYTDGLIYWNEDMPVLDSTQLGNVTTLSANGQLIGWMVDYNGDTTINFPTVPTGTFPFGLYGNSLSSMPSMTIDVAGNIFVSYSSPREDKFTADSMALYRHLYLIKKDADSVNWSAPTDLTSNVLHDFDECVFGSMSPTTDTRIHIVYQADETIGSAVSDKAGYGNNNIYYTNALKSDIGSIGIKENTDAISMNIYPNPSKDYTYIDLNLTKASNVNVSVINLVGQQVINKNFGKLSSGNRNLAIAVSQLNPGIYFFTVQAGNERITRKIIVN